jgi:uncharacterized membrane protein SirB2
MSNGNDWRCTRNLVLFIAQLLFLRYLITLSITDVNIMPKPTLDVSAVDGTLSGVFLAGIQDFDAVTGAAEWASSSRQVAVISAILLGTIRFFARQRCNVNWYSLIHATITGVLSVVCVWLNIFAAVPLTGISEPLGAILCKGPLTSIHAILPAITAGFGIFDIIEGFSHGIDFVSAFESFTTE